MEKKCLEIVKRVLEYIRSHRDEFKERKSLRIFRVFVGDKPWFIELHEYDDLKSMKELDRKLS